MGYNRICRWYPLVNVYNKVWNITFHYFAGKKKLTKFWLGHVSTGPLAYQKSQLLCSGFQRRGHLLLGPLEAGWGWGTRHRNGQRHDPDLLDCSCLTRDDEFDVSSWVIWRHHLDVIINYFTKIYNSHHPERNFTFIPTRFFSPERVSEPTRQRCFESTIILVS